MQEVKPENKTILIVDDEKEVVDYLELILAGEGFRVLRANSGSDAIEMLKENAPIDLITMDLMLPGRGGYDVIQELAQDEQMQEIPVIVITGRMLDPGTEELIRSEVNVKDLCGKPIDQREFRMRIHEVLGTTPRSALAN